MKRLNATFLCPISFEVAEGIDLEGYRVLFSTHQPVILVLLFSRRRATDCIMYGTVVQMQ